jgi:hypothetical protein
MSEQPCPFTLAFFCRRQDRELLSAISRGLLDCPMCPLRGGRRDLAAGQELVERGQRCARVLWRTKLKPDWDPLRGDPRFEQIVAS